MVAYFSGRGPSKISPDIVKPDVLAPGLNILAGMPLKDSEKFRSKLGMSMVAPHVSGLVALLKKVA